MPNMIDSTQITYRSPASNAVGRTLQSKLGDTVNLLEFGAIPNDTTKAVANVAAAQAALTYLASIGGGRLSTSPGVYYFDATTLGSSGLVVPSGVSIEGPGGAVWAVNGDQATCLLITNSGTGSVWLEGGIEFRGMIQFSNLTGGGVKGSVKFTGKLSSTTQLTELSAPGGAAAINVAAAFGQNLTYNDGANNVPSTDYTCTVSGTTVTIALSSSTSLVGNVQYARNVVSDYITLDPTARYVIYITDGFLTGAGGNQAIITAYDANKNPIDMGMSSYPYSTASVANVYNPAGLQNGTRTSILYGASYIKVQVGAYRGYGTSQGLTATFDLSKMIVYKLINDSATWPYIGGPGTNGQVFYSSCSNISVTNASFSMIDQSALKLFTCTNSAVTGCNVQSGMQGFVDDYGVGNSISNNTIDLRIKTTGGAVLNQTAWRLRCVGGTYSQNCVYNRNVGYGASWGMEILPYLNTNKIEVSGNTIYAEYAGVSCHAGDFTANANRIFVGPIATVGLEVPGEGTATRYAMMRGSGNYIKWSSFNGFYGVGVSFTNGQYCDLRDCVIVAPYTAQNISCPVGSTFRMVNTTAEFSCSALLHRSSNSAYVRFLSLTAGSVLSFPYSSIAGTSVFDIQANDPSVILDVFIDHMINGADSVLTETGCGDVRMACPDLMANPAGYYTNFYFAPTWTTSTVKKISFDRIAIRNVPSGYGLNSWAKINGSPYTGSYCYQGTVSVNGNRSSIPGGVWSPSYMRGTPLIVTYLISVNMGTLAIGGSYTMTGQTMAGLSLSGSSGIDIFSYTGGGLAGLQVVFYATADNTYTIKFINISGASLTPPTQSLRIQLNSLVQ